MGVSARHTALYNAHADHESLLWQVPTLGPMQMIDSYLVRAHSAPGVLDLSRPREADARVHWSTSVDYTIWSIMTMHHCREIAVHGDNCFTSFFDSTNGTFLHSFTTDTRVVSVTVDWSDRFVAATSRFMYSDTHEIVVFGKDGRKLGQPLYTAQSRSVSVDAVCYNESYLLSHEKGNFPFYVYETGVSEMAPNGIDKSHEGSSTYISPNDDWFVKTPPDYSHAIVYRLDGTLMRTIPLLGGTTHMAIDADGSFVLSDFCSGLLYVYRKDGLLMRTINAASKRHKNSRHVGITHDGRVCISEGYTKSKLYCID
jgi:hypothetical protein